MLNNNEKGRSMLEMLSVLAIIGVLSAGGLAGYNKAMLWHKLNKLGDEISYLLAVAIYHSDQLKEASFSLAPELQSLGAFTWKIDAKPIDDTDAHAKNVRFYDSLQNQAWFEHSTGNTKFAFGVNLPLSDFTTKVCYSYINVFKGFSDELDAIYVTKARGKDRIKNVYRSKGCTSGKCLAAMTNTDIIDICKTHCADADIYCTLYALWGYPAATVASW
ncbi:MAG: prepilin-type N-terminal cleavage/methylation domain-containing protein [Alphaproteobacteria bacterium]|nr:prepilin-type N-terminal cleavage/methylation domain-containing protein [Alphaproteobacteria bacterium]